MTKRRLSDETIIAALVETGSVKEAAAALQCNTKTIYDRMKKPDFKTLYSQAKADVLKSATAKLQGKVCEAIDTLSGIMNDADAAKQTRVNAAASILTYAARFTETTDILERLEELEAYTAES